MDIVWYSRHLEVIQYAYSECMWVSGNIVTSGNRTNEVVVKALGLPRYIKA